MPVTLVLPIVRLNIGATANEYKIPHDPQYLSRVKNEKKYKNKL
jgi:hypothetical protein